MILKTAMKEVAKQIIFLEYEAFLMLEENFKSGSEFAKEANALIETVSNKNVYAALLVEAMIELPGGEEEIAAEGLNSSERIKQ